MFLLCSFLLVLSGALSRADMVEQGPKDSPPSGLLAGVGRVHINPPGGIVHLNWGAQTHIASEGADPVGMWATALVISDGKQRFAMVDIDTLSVDGLEEAVSQASAQTGIRPEHIRLAASHTHSGPNFSAVRGPAGADLSSYEQPFRTYRKWLAARIAEAIGEAAARLRPVHLHGAKGTGTININRRVRPQAGRPPAVGLNPDGFVDRELVVVRIDDAQGRPYAVLANFPCHGTVLAHENRKISPDWIGSARRTVEAALPGATCLFFQGAAGNQGPVEGLTGDLEVAHRLGARLGHEIAALALGIETVRRAPRWEGFIESTAFLARQPWRVEGPREGALKFASAVLDLPARTYTAREIAELEADLAGAKERLAEIQRSGDPWKIYQAQARLRRISDLLKKRKQPPDTTPRKVQVQILRAAEVAIVAMPGEPFAEIGVAVKNASPFAATMFCGYSSGVGGDYMPVASEYEYGGYEIQRTPYGAGAAEQLIRETIRLFEAVR